MRTIIIFNACVRFTMKIISALGRSLIIPGFKMRFLMKLFVSSIKFIAFTVICTGLSIDVFSQWSPGDFTRPIQILPPSPNAASLGKYGGVDVGLSSGVANFVIPIGNYTSRDIKVPISLNYTSSGFKVDEIASRVGTGWALNAGGVITRTAYGAIDERTERIYPPNGPTTWELFNYMNQLLSYDPTVSGTGPFDAQPDIFNFNFDGHTGQFILDTTRNSSGQYTWQPLLLTHSSLKIERIVVPGGYDFKVTTGNGVQYFFGGSGREYTNSYSEGASHGCGSPYDADVPTAWYLEKIINPNKDSVFFSYLPLSFDYQTNISQSIQIYTGNYQDAACWLAPRVSRPVLNDYTCVTRFTTEGVLLDEINSSAGGKVKFNYIDRGDYDDKLLSSIAFYQPGYLSPHKVFNFQYQHANAAGGYANSYATQMQRPFLTEFIEKGRDGLLTKKHSFLYNDMSSLPPRLSFAQDHWGYFNGKNNYTLIPVPRDPYVKQWLPAATANREPDPNYSSKGLLASISYPTGGKDSIIYEGNQAYAYTTTIPAPTDVSISTGPSYVSGTPLYSDPFVVSFRQQVSISGSCSGQYDPEMERLHISVEDANSNAVYTNTVEQNSTIQETTLLDPGTYRIVITTFQEASGGVTLNYIPGSPSSQFMNVNTGGVRVAKVISTDNVSNTPSIKTYRYSKLTTPEISSGAPPSQLTYEKATKMYAACECAGVLELQLFETYYIMYSNSLLSLYAYSSGPTTYASVVESFGENFENGGIEHEFIVSPNIGASVVNGENVMGMAPSSNNLENGKERYRHVFKKVGTNFVSVKKIFTHYREDPRINQTINAYFGYKKYDFTCQPNPSVPLPSYYSEAFDLLLYGISRKWIYIDTVRTLTYDNDGSNYIEQTEVAEYNNINHALPTQLSQLRSDGKINITKNYYPDDITLTGQEETARQALVAQHNLSPLLKQQILVEDSPVETTKTSYGMYDGDLVLPEGFWYQMGNKPMEKRVEFLNYNSYGKLTAQSKSGDAEQAYLWDYNSLYPVAQVMNATVSDIAYTSFEADGKGNWIFAGSSVDAPDGYTSTGRKCYLLASNNSLTKSDLDPLRTYVISYWYKNGSSITITGGTITENQTHPGHNEWILSVSKVTGTTSITVSGTGFLDEVRLHPVNAQMTTYTYDPLIGITSVTDSNQVTVYYEYDDFDRLYLIKDNKGNVVKRVEYNYQVK